MQCSRGIFHNSIELASNSQEQKDKVWTETLRLQITHAAMQQSTISCSAKLVLAGSNRVWRNFDLNVTVSQSVEPVLFPILSCAWSHLTPAICPFLHPIQTFAKQWKAQSKPRACSLLPDHLFCGSLVLIISNNKRFCFKQAKFPQYWIPGKQNKQTGILFLRREARLCLPQEKFLLCFANKGAAGL